MKRKTTTKLDRYMKATGLTEAQLGYLVDVHQTTIHRIRRGHVPNAAIAMRIQKATNGQVTVEDLAK